MKEYLVELIRKAPTPAHGRNIAREYLQARILGAIQRAGAMIPLAFHGGTALRFLFGHSRYSEDLDFALERSRGSYDFRSYLRSIQAELELEGYRIDLKVNDRKVVHSAFLRFPGLLHELSLSSEPRHVLAVKIEVDTNPPAGARLDTTVIRRHELLQLQHHDQTSMLSGKLHALLQRPYLKGRDVYDLFWYLSDPNWPNPNLTHLNNALRQTGWEGGELAEGNWRGVIFNRLKGIRWERVVADVRPLLEQGAAVDVLTGDNLKRLLHQLR